MNINSLRYCLRQTSRSFSRNKWLALVSASMIAISLGILGGSLLAAVNTNQIMINIQSNLEMAVFLVEDADQEAIEAQLDGLPGITDYRFVSRDDGLREFARSLNAQSLFKELEGENNPLPDMFRVRAAEAELVPELAQKIEGLAGVESVEYGEELVDMLVRVSRWVNRASLTVSILLAAGAIFLIVTTIRLSVLARQEEVSIMKYLGASDWFVRLPFLLEGMLIGWLGTLVAILVLGAGYFRLAAIFIKEAQLFFLQPVTAAEQLVPIFLGLLILGTLMGGIGSTLSIRRFLKV
ncbi:MAG: permease-like cell division protein FtsX [Dethiobacteria bacterium]|jgi:cell division transport system permease protein|nr:ABC transporter permease [Bacillota bacterium]HOP69360.1 permease-like cell division protein FtsX [Bacillota bacterium]HPT33703.1 permease-like cell division protein FtsX [Bacillota bacterium]HPZ64825.1 permease-like cell division protein FtsX [Bacillota bacterium]HQD05732.1 permease-like cell division protein FtsX [Bacillota bacterium]